MAQWQLADGRVVLLTDIEPEIGGCDGDPARQDEARSAEALALKELVADLSLENRLLKKNMTGAGGDPE